MEQRKDLLKNSIKVLNEREKEILYSRRLNDNPTTLEDLSKKHKILITQSGKSVILFFLVALGSYMLKSFL